MASRYYKVGPSVWLEPWDDTTRLAALYVLTSPHRTTEGLYRLPVDYAATDLCWPARKFAKALDELTASGFVEYDDSASIVLIVKALKWQAPQNPNQIKAAVRSIRELPATPLLNRLHELAQLYAERFAEALTEAFPEGFAHPPTPTPTPTLRGSGGMRRNGRPQTATTSLPVS